MILAEQKIEISKEVFVLKNKIHFTQDGKYIFLVFADANRNLWRSLTLDAQGLNHAYELDFDLTKTKVNCKRFFLINNYRPRS